MTYDEIKNLTATEAQNFTWNDMILDKYELIAKAENGSIKLPSDIQNKLRNLCTELAKLVPEKKSFFEKINLQTVKDVANTGASIITIIRGLNDIKFALLLKQIFDEITSYLE